MDERTTASKIPVSVLTTKELRNLRDAALKDAYEAEAWAHDPDKDFWGAAAVDDGLDDATS